MSENTDEAIDRVRRFLDARDGYFPIDVLAVVTRTGDRLLASDLRTLLKEVDPDPVVARFEGFLIGGGRDPLECPPDGGCGGCGNWPEYCACAECAPCFARGVDGEGNPNCLLASGHDGPHSDL